MTDQLEDVQQDDEASNVLSLRDRILQSQDIEAEEVEVKQWGVTVEIRGMSGLERAKFMERFTGQDGNLDYEAMYPSLLIACVHDPGTGDKLFMPEDAAALNAKSGAALEKLAQVALRLSGMGKDSEKELGKDS